MSLEFKELAQRVVDSAMSLVSQVVPGMAESEDVDCPLDPALQLDEDTREVITKAMAHAKGFNAKVYVSWALGGLLAFSLATNALAGGAPATPAAPAEPPTPAPVAQAAPVEEEEEEPQVSVVKVAVVVPEEWPMEAAEVASVTVEIKGTTDDGEEAAVSVLVVPGSSRTLPLDPGAYAVAAKTPEVTLADMVFVANGQTLTVDGLGDALAATVTFALDEAKTQEIADAKAEAQRAAEEEAARQAEAERQAAEEAERQAAAEAEAARQAEAAAAAEAEAQRNEQTVYITDTGSKYHESWCSSLRKSKHAISLSEAQARGYGPCKNCH